jgi:hypothetical protein
MAEMTQNYSNHAKFRPLFHFTALPILLINAIVMIVQAVKHPGAMPVWTAAVWLFVFLWAFDNRGSILTVQDRVIRDEMRMRLERVLGAGAKGAIDGLTPEHLIGLRFASDKELPALVERVKKGELADRKAIKQAVKEWQGDHLRA